jgi:hypothetical protein
MKTKVPIALRCADYLPKSGKMRRTPSYARRSESLRKRCESVRKKSPELKAGRINRSGARSTLPKTRREYRRTCETAGKSGKQIERCVISIIQIAEKHRFLTDFRQWEDPLLTGD